MQSRTYFQENVKNFLSILALLFFYSSYTASWTITPNESCDYGGSIHCRRSTRRKDSASLCAGRMQCRYNYGRVEGDVRRYALTSFDKWGKWPRYSLDPASLSWQSCNIPFLHFLLSILYFISIERFIKYFIFAAISSRIARIL